MKKKSIRNIVVFAIIFVLIFSFLSMLLKPRSIKGHNLTALYNEKENTIDVMFVGASSTTVFWVPYIAWEEYGMASFNYSENALSPSLIKGLMKESQKYQKPQLYVIDLRSFETRERSVDYFSVSYLRRIVDSMKLSLNKYETLFYAYGKDQPDALKDLSIYLDLLYYHSNWKEENFEDFKLSNIFYTSPSDNKGHVIYDGCLEVKPIDKVDYSYITETKSICESSQEILNDILDYCDSLNVKVLFTVNTFQMKDVETKKWFNYIKEVVTSRGYDYLDTNEYYDEMGLNFDHDFYDINHVNVLGAEKYTKFLAKYINDNYCLPNRKDDINYIEWNNYYPVWKEEFEKAKEETESRID